MWKIKIGDIFEINTPKGKAYLHYIHKDEKIGELIRVLPGLHDQKPISFEKLATSEERYVIFFPLAAANRRKIVERVGFYPADNFKKPKYMRTEFMVRGEFLGWHIVNTETWQRELVPNLTLDQKKLSPWGVWNDALLIEKLVNNWSLQGWN